MCFRSLTKPRGNTVGLVEVWRCLAKHAKRGSRPEWPVPKHRAIERSARFAVPEDGPSLGIVEFRTCGSTSTRKKIALAGAGAAVAAIAASEDIGTTLHFCVKVSPAPERLSAPGLEAVLTACCFGDTPLHFNVYQELTAASRCRKSNAVERAWCPTPFPHARVVRSDARTAR